jgi:hypothetical protein
MLLFAIAMTKNQEVVIAEKIVKTKIKYPFFLFSASQPHVNNTAMMNGKDTAEQIRTVLSMFSFSSVVYKGDLHVYAHPVPGTILFLGFPGSSGITVPSGQLIWYVPSLWPSNSTIKFGLLSNLTEKFSKNFNLKTV